MHSGRSAPSCYDSLLSAKESFTRYNCEKERELIFIKVKMVTDSSFV